MRQPLIGDVPAEHGRLDDQVDQRLRRRCRLRIRRVQHRPVRREGSLGHGLPQLSPSDRAASTAVAARAPPRSTGADTPDRGGRLRAGEQRASGRPAPARLPTGSLSRETCACSRGCANVDDSYRAGAVGCAQWRMRLSPPSAADQVHLRNGPLPLRRGGPWPTRDQPSLEDPAE